MLTLSEKHNPNYLAKIVKISNVNKHPNADRLQVVNIDGNSVITAKASVGDLVVFFPLECTINDSFLSYSNSFENKELNNDTKVKGFFNNKGRVRAVKLRGQPSMGYIVPLALFAEWLRTTLNYSFEDSELKEGTEFDSVGSLLVCKKYVVKGQSTKQVSEKTSGTKQKAKKQSRLVDNQFRLHVTTPKLGVNLHNIHPESLINITRKLHGTSAVISKVLTKKKLNWKEKVAKFLGVSVIDTEYSSVYSSRKVIKNQHFNDNKVTGGYYGEDIWGVVAKELDSYLLNGMTIYAEVVGYLPSGNFIQKGYDYGCAVGEHETYVYRITMTNPDGVVVEMPATQVQAWCQSVGLKAVPLLYEGKAINLFNHIQSSKEWREDFLANLQNTYLEKDDTICINRVPDEGICLRVEGKNLEVYKLRSFRFMEKESKDLDNEVVDIEEDQKGEEAV